MKRTSAVIAVVIIAAGLGGTWSCGRDGQEKHGPASGPTESSAGHETSEPPATAPTATADAGGSPAHDPAHAISPMWVNPLFQLFRGHGIPCTIGSDGKKVVFPGPGIVADWEFDQEQRFPNAVSVELSVRFFLPDQRRLAEWYAGIGRDRAEAERNAWYNFASNTLHVLLAVLFRPGQPDNQVEFEKWVVGGRVRDVVIGPGTIRGEIPPEPAGSIGFFGAFEKAVKAQPLPAGIHWARLFYARQSSGEPLCEVLLDSEPWKDVQAEMAAYPWPRSDKFYTVRVFVILNDEPVNVIPRAPAK
jgi:hypothetical protein